MQFFTVAKPGGTKDFEFEAYTRLLESIGVDVANVPRTPEPETQRRWLYTWQERDEAEEFAAQLRKLTRDNLWFVYSLEASGEERGPIAPLDIFEVQENEQSLKYYLTPSSRERVIRSFPHSRLYPVTISREDLAGMQNQFGPVWWDQLAIVVTGLSVDKILSLGGYRVVLPDGTIGHETIPGIPAVV